MTCIKEPTEEMKEHLARIEELKGLKPSFANKNNSNTLTERANKDLLSEYDKLFGLLGNDDSVKACLMKNIRNNTGGRRARRKTRYRKVRKSKTRRACKI